MIRVMEAKRKFHSEVLNRRFKFSSGNLANFKCGRIPTSLISLKVPIANRLWCLVKMERIVIKKNILEMRIGYSVR